MLSSGTDDVVNDVDEALPSSTDGLLVWNATVVDVCRWCMLFAFSRLSSRLIGVVNSDVISTAWLAMERRCPSSSSSLFQTSVLD